MNCLLSRGEVVVGVRAWWGALVSRLFGCIFKAGARVFGTFLGEVLVDKH